VADFTVMQSLRVGWHLTAANYITDSKKWNGFKSEECMLQSYPEYGGRRFLLNTGN
jgi:hypothetical protein